MSMCAVIKKGETVRHQRWSTGVVPPFHMENKETKTYATAMTCARRSPGDWLKCINIYNSSLTGLALLPLHTEEERSSCQFTALHNCILFEIPLAGIINNYNKAFLLHVKGWQSQTIWNS